MAEILIGRNSLARMNVGFGHGMDGSKDCHADKTRDRISDQTSEDSNLLLVKDSEVGKAKKSVSRMNG